MARLGREARARGGRQGDPARARRRRARGARGTGGRAAEPPGHRRRSTSWPRTTHDVYLVSELVRGRTLAELTRAGAISDRDVARIGVALCEALEHAHARGVIHRDVKPGNVMVLAEPAAGAGFAKLADFGVAHVASGDPLTRTGDIVGTLAYMAPEQAEGARVTPACDVYSLALTLYEAWTGTNPVKAAGPAATARRLGRPLPSLARMRRDLPRRALRRDRRRARHRPHAPPGSGAAAGGAARGRVRAHRRGRPRRAGHAAQGRAAPRPRAGAGRSSGLLRGGDPADGPLPGSELQPRKAGGRRGIRERIGAGLAAGGLVLACILTLGPEPVVLALRRRGPRGGGHRACCRASAGSLAVIGLCAWLVSPEADRQGTALVLAGGGGAGPVPAAARRAPVVGPDSRAAARHDRPGARLRRRSPHSRRRPARRAGLAAAGLWWLVLGEALTGRALLFGSPDGTMAALDLGGLDLGGASSDALEPLVTTPALAPALAWAAGAVVLALVVRGRWLAAGRARRRPVRRGAGRRARRRWATRWPPTWRSTTRAAPWRAASRPRSWSSSAFHMGADAGALACCRVSRRLRTTLRGSR